MIRNKWLLLAFRLVVGGIFIWAGLLKVVDPLGFAQSIENYRFFPHEITFWLAIILPWMEILCGVFLVLGILRRASALLVSLLLLGFIGLVAVAITRGIDTSCGCFGSLSRKADLGLVLVDSVLLFFAFNILISPSPPRNP